MSQLSALKAAASLHDLAALLGFTPAGLAYLIYKKPASRKYSEFQIAKRGGGMRKICAPSSDLKLLQRRLADLLQNCADTIQATTGRKNSMSHGFVKSRSILTNAGAHRGRRYVFNLDLADFFDSINFGRVRGFFISNRDFALHPTVATVIAQIACHENRLPQGSPCSPVVSNLIGSILDVHLVRLAARTGCTYTRYADDLTFSTGKREFPAQVANRDLHNPHKWVPGAKLSLLIVKCGFEVNFSKIRMQYRDSRQEVTGLIVNKKINVRSEYRHTVRAMVHRLFTKGEFTFPRPAIHGAGSEKLAKGPADPSQLHGMLGFIDSVDLVNEAVRRKLKSSKSVPGRSTKELMYRRFLLFDQLYAASSPMVICEGKTDYIYLLHAIRSLVLTFPQLAILGKDGEIKLKVRLYKHRGGSTGRLLGLTGGAGNLNQLVLGYHGEAKRFKAPGMYHPVILLIDSDDGATSLLKVVGQVCGHKPRLGDEFTHVASNMYVVSTPLIGGASKSCIEDLFDASTKAIAIGGKTFNPDAETDSAIHYGKVVFAHKVVAPQAPKIDFSGFVPILRRIVSVMDAHAKKMAGGSGAV